MQRTDDDTWDLATSVGATATMVAAARAHATNADVPLIEDRFAEPLVRAVGIDFFTRWATGELDLADVDGPDAPWGLQRMTDLLTARTRYFDEFFADAAASGIRQAVILASGLDARGYRLAWPAGTTVFEIDQPDVLDFKVARLAELGAEPRADVRMVGVDLRNDWASALRDAGFDSTAPTAWIAEGLFPFLPPEAQDRLLDTITELSADGSRLASESFVNNPSDDADREQMQGVTQRWKDNGFDVELGELGFDGERRDVEDYLNGLGWQSTRTVLSQLLADTGLPADVPNLAGDNYYCTSVLRG